MAEINNIVIAGLGGQGVLKASDILAEAAFRAGFDVKKAEVHGMSQRGGSVSSDIRFGTEVQSPMVPAGEADFVVVLEPNEEERNKPVLSKDGELISSNAIDIKALPNPKSLNVAMLGALSAKMDKIPEACWFEAIKDNLPEKLHEMNITAFNVGRDAVK